MTPKLAIRTFSNDQYILDKVFYSNYYCLKGIKDENAQPIVVDIGAHCGYFAFAAIAVGAKKVYSFEPFTENYKMLVRNFDENPMRNIVTNQLGVYTNNINLEFVYPEVKNSYFDFADIAVNTLNAKRTQVSPCFTLDTILNTFVQDKKIDILKLSIGYSEAEILTKSKALETNVTSICGETSIEPDSIEKFKTDMASKGFINAQISKSQEEDKKILFLFSKEDLTKHFNPK